jgi:glycosyltransferase involved in cell wall biosynthesis
LSDSARPPKAIIYLTFATLSSPTAHSVQIVKMCQAMAKAGAGVKLVADVRQSPRQIFEFYNVRYPFEIVRIRLLPVRIAGRVVFLARSFFLILKNRRCIFYTRDVFTAWFVRTLRVEFMMEVHELPSGRFQNLLMRRILSAVRLRTVVFISEELRKCLLRRMGDRLARQTTVVAHDGADLDEFPSPLSRDESRRKLHLPEGAFMAGYTGSLFEGRGLEVILGVSRVLKDAVFVIVGGEKWQADRLKRKVKEAGLANVLVIGFVPHQMVPAYLAAFDALLMPYQETVLHRQKKHDTASYMSPLKAFEYMAAGRPIVASRLKVIGEILEDGRNAILVPPDSVTEWAGAIRLLRDNEPLGRKIGEQARDDVRKFSWDERVKKIFLK